MGRDAKRIFLTIQQTLKRGNVPDANPELVEKFKTFEMGERVLGFEDIKITPYRVDHSAYDSYMFLVEADGKRILHTGDFRSHGWTGEGLWGVLKHYIKEVDALITEGTMLTREKTKIYSEKDLLKDATDLMRDEKYVFVLCSSVNIDSIWSFYQAALRNGRKFVCDGYQKDILRIVSETATHGPYKMVSAMIYFDEMENHADRVSAM
jgi:ribonuclease J